MNDDSPCCGCVYNGDNERCLLERASAHEKICITCISRNECLRFNPKKGFKNLESFLWGKRTTTTCLSGDHIELVVKGGKELFKVKIWVSDFEIEQIDP